MPALQPSVYETDRLNRKQQNQSLAARGKLMRKHRNDVEAAIVLDKRAKRIEADIVVFDDDSTGFRMRVRVARVAFRIAVATALTICLIAVADFWLATPDISENLASKATSLTTAVSGEAPPANDEGVSDTPVWLRVSIAIILVVGFIALTLWSKEITDGRQLRDSLQQLTPGDDLGYRNLQTGIWFRRGGRVAYMVVLAGLFNFLYTYDLRRAELVADAKAFDRDTKDWSEVGVRISGGELVTDEAIGDEGDAADTETTGNTNADMAKSSVVIYCLLWMLHGVLMLTPSIPATDDLRLRRFDRAKAETKCTEMREKEEAILRDIHERIRGVAPEVRQDFLREAIPVAKRLNIAVGWPAIDVPGGSEEPTLSEAPTPLTAEPPANTSASVASAESPTKTSEGNGSYASDDDIYEAIWGASRA
jgi:hypothetical protein